MQVAQEIESLNRRKLVEICPGKGFGDFPGRIGKQFKLVFIIHALAFRDFRGADVLDSQFREQASNISIVFNDHTKVLNDVAARGVGNALERCCHARRPAL